MKEKKWLTLEEVVEITHISERTLREKIKLGLLPSYKPGKRRLIDARELELFIRRHRAS
jgi:excisionase family DNA binding protein